MQGRPFQSMYKEKKEGKERGRREGGRLGMMVFMFEHDDLQLSLLFTGLPMGDVS